MSYLTKRVHSTKLNKKRMDLSVWKKKSNYFKCSLAIESSSDKRRTSLEGCSMPFHIPSYNPQIILHNLTHWLPPCRCVITLKDLLANTLKTEPTRGNVHKTSIVRGNSSTCKEHGLSPWSSRLLSHDKKQNFNPSSAIIRYLILWDKQKHRQEKHEIY